MIIVNCKVVTSYLTYCLQEKRLEKKFIQKIKGLLLILPLSHT